MAPQILLVSLNSTYQHCSFGLRYLLANMKELQPASQILESTIQVGAKNLAEKIIRLNPKIVGFGVYIWNSSQTLEVVSILKKVAPQMIIVLGGPEVSHESEGQPLVQLADHTITGEADFAFYEFCRDQLGGQKKAAKIIRPALPDIQHIQLPYDLYTDEDIKNRIIYVEASRGCPYRCEYCLSSLDKQVRSFSLPVFLGEIKKLIDRGARQFKFVDRTFNLSISTGLQILEFFLGHIELGLFLHFEMVPDRLPEELKALLKKFPPGAIQFEIGIQTWSPEVAKLVSRKNDISKVIENFRFLKQETGIHSHADLIVGLPGETLESFAHGFDQLWACHPDEVQVGILKRLKGTPIIRHDHLWEMSYQDQQPFQILQTKTMDFLTIQRLVKFAKFWDLYANSGNFPHCTALLLQQGPSPFWAFLKFSDELSQKSEQQHSFSLESLAQYLYTYGCEHQLAPEGELRKLIIADYCNGAKKRDLPNFLKLNSAQEKGHSAATATKRNQRQQAHQAARSNEGM